MNSKRLQPANFRADSLGMDRSLLAAFGLILVLSQSGCGELTGEFEDEPTPINRQAYPRGNRRPRRAPRPVRLFTPDERAQIQQDAQNRFNELLDQFSVRYEQAQELSQNVSPGDRDRLFSEALGQNNLGNTCYANSAHAFLWAMNFRPHPQPSAAPSPEAPQHEPREMSQALTASAGLRNTVRGAIQGFENFLESNRNPQRPDIYGYLDGRHPLIGFQHDSSEYLTQVMSLLDSARALERSLGGFELATQVTFSEDRANTLRFITAENEPQERILQNRWELDVWRPASSENARPRLFNSLQEALDSALSPTAVEGVLLDSNENERLNGTKRQYLIRTQTLPSKLIFKLNRFEMIGNQRRKVTQNIFANRRLILNYSEDENHLNSTSQMVLRPKAAIIHHGDSAEGGHYTTLINHQGQWFHHDDTRVQSVEDRVAFQLMSRSGYVFLYEPTEHEIKSNEPTPQPRASDSNETQEEPPGTPDSDQSRPESPGIFAWLFGRP